LNYLNTIKTAIIFFPFLALFFTIPYILQQYHKYGSINKLRSLIVYSFILYLLVVYFLVILPLPSIEEVINMDPIKPRLIPFSFINDIITGEVSEKLILEDKNGVISNYDVGLSKYHNISIDDDKLIITFNDEEKPMEEVTLSKKHYDNKTLLVYVKDNSQKLASLRLSNQDELSLRVQNKETPTEVVRVPNTLEDDIVKRFDVVIGFNYNASRFN